MQTDIETNSVNSSASSGLLLGIESRSILKSILTEEAKLTQSSTITRSDLHYFRARYNYYRLSLLRLLPEERGILEPVLGRFFEKINRSENSEGISPDGKAAAPFIHAVERPAVLRSESQKVVSRPSELSVLSVNPEVSAPKPSSIQSELMDDIIGQLQLVKIGLTADITPEARRILVDGVERLIGKLQKNK